MTTVAAPGRSDAAPVLVLHPAVSLSPSSGGLRPAEHDARHRQTSVREPLKR